VHLLGTLNVELPASLTNSIVFFVVIAIACPIGLTGLALFEAAAESRRSAPRAASVIAIILSLTAFVGWLLTFAAKP
jgi:hypothetical protein